jgi:hypothetical protein
MRQRSLASVVAAAAVVFSAVIVAGDITRVVEAGGQPRVTSGAAQGSRPADPTARLLQELIRLDTSNPPGHEGQMAELLASKLKPLGFEIEIVPTLDAGKAHLRAMAKLADYDTKVQLTPARGSSSWR